MKVRFVSPELECVRNYDTVIYVKTSRRQGQRKGVSCRSCNYYDITYVIILFAAWLPTPHRDFVPVALTTLTLSSPYSQFAVQQGGIISVNCLMVLDY